MSFGIMINSWNAQGGSKGKIQYLEHLISKSCKNILFLQEEGAPGTSGFQKDETVTIGNTEFVCLAA